MMVLTFPEDRDRVGDVELLSISVGAQLCGLLSPIGSQDLVVASNTLYHMA